MCRAAPTLMLRSPIGCQSSSAPDFASAATNMSIAGQVCKFNDGEIVALIPPNAEESVSNMLRIGVEKSVACDTDRHLTANEPNSCDAADCMIR